LLLIFVFVLVVVEANKDAPALDSDTAFFLEDKSYLGKVWGCFYLSNRQKHCSKCLL